MQDNVPHIGLVPIATDTYRYIYIYTSDVDRP